MGRYERNGLCVTPEETERLHQKRVCVVGCGGLGGYVLEMLGRVGVGYLTAIDGDVFALSNLNRQILSDVNVLGKSKAETARDRMQLVNPEIRVTPRNLMVTEENADDLLAGHDLVVDALDVISARLVLEDSCERLGIPLVHGAIGGWFGEVSVVEPGDRTLHFLYEGMENQRGEEASAGTPSFTPAAVAALQAAEVIKVLLGKGSSLRGQLLMLDLLNQEYQVLPLK